MWSENVRCPTVVSSTGYIELMHAQSHVGSSCTVQFQQTNCTQCNLTKALQWHCMDVYFTCKHRYAQSNWLAFQIMLHEILLSRGYPVQ